MKITKKGGVPASRNWVAKNMHKVCKPAIHKDKKKDYVRTSKHQKRDFGVSFLRSSVHG